MKLNRESIANIIKEVEAGNAYTVNKNLLRESTINRFKRAYTVEAHKADSNFLVIRKPSCPVIHRTLQNY